MRTLYTVYSDGSNCLLEICILINYKRAKHFIVTISRDQHRLFRIALFVRS
jgi:hypothetical protein